MKMTTIGIGLAKLVFQIHGVDAHDKVALKRQLKRAQMLTFFAKPGALSRWHGGLWRCPLLGPQTLCDGAHGDADGSAIREAIMKTMKNDAVDAEAICEAVARPSMRFVPGKTAEQQAIPAAF